MRINAKLEGIWPINGGDCVISSRRSTPVIARIYEKFATPASASRTPMTSNEGGGDDDRGNDDGDQSHKFPHTSAIYGAIAQALFQACAVRQRSPRGGGVCYYWSDRE